MHPITVRLAKLVSDFGWTESFEQALNALASQRSDAWAGITTLDQFLGCVDALDAGAPA